MLKELRELITKCNPDYQIIYEQKNMMNVKVDHIKRDESFAYIEAFADGTIQNVGYKRYRIMTVQVYFSKFVAMEADAIIRLDLIEQINKEIADPFIKAYENTPYYTRNSTIGIGYPPAMWDDNEVSVLLEFKFQEEIC